LNLAFQFFNISYETLLSNAQDQWFELCFSSDVRLRCLHDFARLQVSLKFVSLENRWWTVNLYLSDTEWWCDVMKIQLFELHEINQMMSRADKLRLCMLIERSVIISFRMNGFKYVKDDKELSCSLCMFVRVYIVCNNSWRILYNFSFKRIKEQFR
jgi:hypothetical protein